MSEKMTDKLIFNERNQSEISNEINNLELSYHGMIYEEYNNNVDTLLEKCKLLKNSCLFGYKNVQFENSKFEENLLHKFLKNEDTIYDEVLEFLPASHVIWSASDIEKINTYFEGKFSTLHDSFKLFDEHVQEISTANIENLKNYMKRYYKMINMGI